jgi:hypothetical protein
MSSKTVHQRLVRAAAANGTGLRLNADEVFTLGALDDAITTRAQMDDEEEPSVPSNGRGAEHG